MILRNTARRSRHSSRPSCRTRLLRDHSTCGKTWLSQFEVQERQRTGIASLHIGFNKVFGYYIEVRKSHLNQVPEDYVRKQTLVNAERFVTPALKDREVQMLRAEEQALHLERQLYSQLCEHLASHTMRIQHVAQMLGQLDVLTALAEVALTRQYCRPQLDNSRHHHYGWPPPYFRGDLSRRALRAK